MILRTLRNRLHLATLVWMTMGLLPLGAGAHGLQNVVTRSPAAAILVVEGATTIHVNAARPPGFWGAGASSRTAQPSNDPRQPARGLLSATAHSVEHSTNAMQRVLDPIVDPLLETTTAAAGTVVGTALGIALYPPVKVLEHLVQ